MKYLLYCIILSLLPTVIFAQLSIGFEHADSINILRDYRLPDWGYRSFYIDPSLQSGGNVLNQNDTSAYTEERSNSHGLDLNPGFTRYHESEDLIYTIHIRLPMFLNMGSQIEDKEQSKPHRTRSYETDSFNFYPGANIDGNLKKYINHSVFFDFSASSSFDYSRRNRDYFTNQHDFQLNEATIRDYSIKRNELYFYQDISTGIGFGRIRNVTPLIHALRFNERLNTISSKNLSGDQIISVAHTFTKRDTYTRIYDRPERYFWRDVNQSTGKQLNNLTPYELFYLRDALDENIGSRWQGYTVTFSPILEYNINSDNERREEIIEYIVDDHLVDTDTDTTKSDTKNYYLNGGVQLQAQWYHNISLDHQIGIEGQAQYGKNFIYEVDSPTKLKYQVDTELVVHWLWVLADRWLWSNQLVNEYQFHRLISQDDRYETDNDGRLETRLISNFSYRIENQLVVSLSGSISNFYWKPRDARINNLDEWQWSLKASMRYYFNRTLF